MNFKITTYLFVILGLIMLFSSIYAEGECNPQTGPADATWLEDNATCICVQTVSMNGNGVQSTSYIASCSDPIPISTSGGNSTQSSDANSTQSSDANSTQSPTTATTSSNEDTTQSSEEIDVQVNSASTNSSTGVGQSTTECQIQIKEYNKKIKDLYSSHSSFIKEKQTNIKNARDEINRLLKEYNNCKPNKQQGRLDEINKKPTITGNFILGNSVSIENVIGSDQVMAITIAEAPTVSGTINNDDEQFIASEDLVAAIDNENNSFLTSVDVRLNTTEGDENLSTDCVAIKEKIKKQMEIIKKNLLELHDFKDQNKELVDKVKELIRNRNQLIKNCMGVQTTIECKVPEELLNKLRELEIKMSTVKGEIISDTDASQDNYSEYTSIKEEYLAITNKIKVIKDDCQIRGKVASGQDRICQEKADIIRNMDEIKNALEQTTNDEEAYQLKTKLEYLQQKFSGVICADPNFVGSKDEVAISSIKISANAKNNLRECITSLVDKAAVDEEIATNACAQKYSQEGQGYKERIMALEQKIGEQQDIITNLKAKMLGIQQKINNATSETKTQFIEENASDLKTDTIAKIDRKIESLKKLIENIDSSDLDDTKKEEMIDSINNNIASLNRQKENIQNSETTDELKTYLTEARNADGLANRGAIISGIKTQTMELERIMNKYFLTNQDYQSLKLELDALKAKIASISQNSSDTEINSLKEQYKALRDKIISSSQEVETQ